MPVHNIEINIADWSTQKEALAQIRKQVFIIEQNVPEELEWDEHDQSSKHYLATINGQAVATARLKPDGQLGRMAVLAPHRNQGIGSKLLEFILLDARKQNYQQLYLHAQLDAIAFYEKQNFIAQGDVFYEANIPHREMLKKFC